MLENFRCVRNQLNIPNKNSQVSCNWVLNFRSVAHVFLISPLFIAFQRMYITWLKDKRDRRWKYLHGKGYLCVFVNEWNSQIYITWENRLDCINIDLSAPKAWGHSIKGGKKELLKNGGFFHTIREWLRLAGTSGGFLIQAPAPAGPPRAVCSGPYLDRF